ncbi:unnamed protein product [Adineta ricciae]|uniref:Uncharacterized protein n=1 Tax=Adineta ricciae TaxID=249248 RepID=A0A815B3D7_ADIRI|nr:unnamed protein product [Adineta ricciae]
MSKRSSVLDDKELSKMVLDNLKIAAGMNFRMEDVLNKEQMRMLEAYREIYTYDPSLSFFLSLGMISHFSQSSYYTHYSSSDRYIVQLYMWLIGASVDKAITKTENLFPSTYLKPMMINGSLTESPVSSIVTHTNHIGLRQHLSTNHKILLNDDADLIAENFGLYNVSDSNKEHERNVILCGYDGFKNSSRTTGTTMIHIGDKRLTILIATTGGKLLKNLRNWSNLTGFDGTHNRFIYMAIPKKIHTRPQNFQRKRYSSNNPSFNHLCVIVHLFGTVRYVFEMTESERENIYGAKFDHLLNTDARTQSQSQNDRSALYTLWNLIADLSESNDLVHDQQRQITDFYEKIPATVPRIACLTQMFFNAMSILNEVHESVIFSDGDDDSLSIDENFIKTVQNIIKEKFYVYDMTYLPYTTIDQTKTDPMIIVRKEAVLVAWKWYEHHLDLVTTLFTINYSFSTKPVTTHKSEQKNLKRLIMLLDFNIFPLSVLTDRHPITKQTGILKNRPALGEQALRELINNGLLKFNHFLIDSRGRKLKSYMKIPLTTINDPSRELLNKVLITCGVSVDEYASVYNQSSIPANYNLSPLSVEISKYSSCFIPAYKQYLNQLQTVIHEHIQNKNIEEVEDGCFVIKNKSVFTRNYSGVENLSFCNPQKALRDISTSNNIANATTNSVIQLEKEMVSGLDIPPCEINQRECGMRPQDPDEASVNEHHTDVIRKTPELRISHISRELDDSSVSTSDRQIEIQVSNEGSDETCSSISISGAVKKVSKTDSRELEQQVIRAMGNILCGPSVVYTKTDMTHLCNKPTVRLEAIQRLIAAELLQHGNNYWLEPSRSKKNDKKDSKRLLREGWMKKVPALESDASKFEFIELLQEKANITFEDYMRSFYPHQSVNVFTKNNWTLSDECIQIFQSNDFYREHVRWDVVRFGPSDALKETNINEEKELPLTQISCPSSCQRIETADTCQVQTTSEQTHISIPQVNETISTLPVTVRPKRKVRMIEDQENEINMNTNSAASSARKLVEITDEEHTLILMMRKMRLDEIMVVMNLNNSFPVEVPNKYRHIRNIINLYFQKSYEIHHVRTIIEFISTHPLYAAIFQQHSLRQMLDQYRTNKIAESVNAHELYLQPFSTKCIECQTTLKPAYTHRAKTVMSLTRTFKALIATCYCSICDLEIFPNFYIYKKKKFVTSESIKNDKYIYLNGNQIFDQNLLIDFDQHLIQNTVSFEGYTNAYNVKIKLIGKRQDHSGSNVDDSSVSFLNEKYFQMVWLLINVAKFTFMTTNEKVVQIPMSVRDVDECNPYFLIIKDELYKNFVAFWTNHQRFSKKCNSQTCSKVFVVDGHQKANRLVCQYKDVFDCSIPELGPVQMGCLYSPLRNGMLAKNSTESYQICWKFRRNSEIGHISIFDNFPSDFCTKDPTLSAKVPSDPTGWTTWVYSLILFIIAPGVNDKYCQHHQPATLASEDQMASVKHRRVEDDKEQTLDKLALIDYIKNDGQYDDSLCNVFRSGTNVKGKVSTYGFLATFLSCAVIVGFTELPCSEGS